jgi:hypothetical protein
MKSTHKPEEAWSLTLTAAEARDLIAAGDDDTSGVGSQI